MSSGKNSTDLDYKPSNSFRQAFVFTKDEKGWNIAKEEIKEMKDVSYALTIKQESGEFVTYIQLCRRKYFNKDFFSFSELKRCYGLSYDCKNRFLENSKNGEIIWNYGYFNPNLGGKCKQMKNFDEEISDDSKTIWEKEYIKGKIVRLKKSGGKWYVDFRRKKKDILAKRGATYRLDLFLDIIKDIIEQAEKINFKSKKISLSNINS